jgi:hypothetical protein
MFFTGWNALDCLKGMVSKMDGSILGSLAGAGYFLTYQAVGMFLGFLLLKKEEKAVRILLGSVFGSVLLQWVPAVFSLGMGFNRASHITALIMTIVLFVCVPLYWQKKEGKGNMHLKKAQNGSVFSWREVWQENSYFLVILPVFLFFAAVLSTHTIPFAEDGSIHTGQATYGDMNMHLSFITSIAKQGIFPPEYSMLPGTKLSYPFLCDTVSSSIYLWGSSLRLAYVFPMLFAVCQVFFGVLIFAKEVLKSRTKAVIAWLFFFLNGGFGIYYFVKGASQDSSVFTRIFTEFYQTPTNYLDENIRWANIVVDMLLPQRATLFGWAVLIPALLVLYQAVLKKERKYFVVAAVLSGCLPMIHTHSFLAMAFVCAMWLIYSVRTELNKGWKSKESKIELWVLFGFFLMMCSLDLVRKGMEVPEQVYFAIALAGISAIGVICIVLTIRGLKNERSRELVLNWGILLGVVLLLALPQLFAWTFQQAQGEQFVRGYFNWANLNDTYLGFYVKNIGIVWILSIVALVFTRSRNYFLVSPSFFIWFVAELIVFQPNVYDNNKILYIGYLFLCFLSADYLVEIAGKFKNTASKGMIYAGVLFLSSISAILTMGREYVSDYQLYGKDEIAVCKYIEENTEEEDVILTDTRHNNGVVSLTGRNIVCGAGTFLYYHGLSFEQQQENVMEMYQNPTDLTLFDKYGVNYIFISSSERSNYGIVSEDAFLQYFEVEYRSGEAVLYRRK